MAEKNEQAVDAPLLDLSRGLVFDGKAKADNFTTYEELNAVVEAKNELLISCPFCKSTILKPLSATLVDKELFLPDVTATHSPDDDSATKGKTLRYHWFLSDMMVFENIGFTKSTGGGGEAGKRYLACADCEVGPIGVSVVTGHSGEFYVTAEKVKYSKT